MTYSFENITTLAEFHHIGFATKSIKQESKFFECLGYRQENNIFIDKDQGIRGCFMIGNGPRIELLENLPDSKILDSWLKKRIGMYHSAYFVNNMELAISQAEAIGGITVREPQASVAFEGRKIAFIMFSNNLLIEFIDKHIS